MNAHAPRPEIPPALPSTAALSASARDSSRGLKGARALLSGRMGRVRADQWEYVPPSKRQSSSIVISVLVLASPVVITAIGVVAWYLVEVLLLQRWTFWLVFALLLFGAYRLARPKPRPPVVLRVVGDRELAVEIPELQLLERIGLEEIDDVVLDVRTVEPVRELAGPNPALRFIDATVGPAYNEARITLATRDDRIPLFRERIPSIEVEQPFVELRKFLRRHGWKPLAERERKRTR